MSQDPMIAALEGKVAAAQFALNAAHQRVSRNAEYNMTPAYNALDAANTRYLEAVTELEAAKLALGDRVGMVCPNCHAQPGLSASAVRQAGGWYCPVCGQYTRV
jgi:hypothetical protein